MATFANHALAAWAGTWLAGLVAPKTLAWTIGLLFLAFALWALRPDQLDAPPRTLHGVLVSSLVAFFIAEIGDKTQLATIALAARFDSLVVVTLGTTLGMMLANLPAVWIGERLATKVSMRAIRWLAAALFAATGIATILAAAWSS